MVSLNTCLTISFVLLIALSDGCLEFLANLTDLNPPTNITIVDRQLGEVTFSWNDGLSEFIKAQSHVRYLFEYKYFDSQTWQEITEENKCKLDKDRPCLTNLFDLFEEVTDRADEGDRETLASNFSCVLYNHSAMNCTWYCGRKAPNDTQYKMYYRQNDATLQCTHYMDVGGRQECHIDQGTVDVEENILICVNGSSNSRMIQQYYTEFDPQVYEVYNPPVNLEVLPNLTVKWDMPPGYAINIDCFAFELNVTDQDEGRTEFFTCRYETKYVLVNIKPTTRYSVKVRMKLKHCKETKFWSHWSNEVFIEPVQVPNVYWMLITLAILVVVLGLILMFVFKRYRLLEIVLKPIPSPQKKFNALFEEYNGDFQNWINCQIPVSKVDECQTVVIEESLQSEELRSFHCHPSMHLP
ncbi:granulocyte-macrophage colony-stimulating factor receptor subunit alpha-like [Rhincodon typus]|uniref:granulocyte-macrophage colony-stimulating factor receptor subunit alpha-like n=1 Tax=Rhincodon typus TaxID=259920 RepID=UPI00202E3CAD|nr:granulocyte-macrophage colony-stimulating factor receptor subunit alpha-like [Rhincodon typus]